MAVFDFTILSVNGKLTSCNFQENRRCDRWPIPRAIACCFTVLGLTSRSKAVRGGSRVSGKNLPLGANWTAGAQSGH
jgi:hypothetical protein